MIEARLRVIYGDTDQMGVVYYANYFRYFELARGEFFRAKGGSYAAVEKEEGLFLPVVDARCQYKASARYDDVLLIRVEVTRLKRASMAFGYTVLRESDRALLCVGETVHACVGKDGRPVALPKSIVSVLGEVLPPA
ncbi:MAG: acyl-CoA thioesterase [Myxococcaceae bacterium]|nr:acyl-CoA thioesterase [Myxococcaceae bacterium]